MPAGRNLTSRVARRAGGGLRGFLALAACLLLLTPAASAQFALPGKGPASKPEAAASPAEQRAQTEAELAEAQRQQAALEATAGTQAIAGDERVRLLDRLVGSYGGRLHLLDELTESNRASPEQLRQQSLTAEFAAPPPYSAVRVEAVRDEYDLARERLHSLEAQQRALEAQKAGQLVAQKRLAEAARLAQDRVAGARSDEDKAGARQAAELAALRLKTAEAELVTLVTGIDVLQRHAASQRASTEDLQQLIQRILPERRLTAEDLDKQLQVLGSHLAKISAENNRIIAEAARLTSERERLARDPAKPGSAAADPRRIEVLDANIQTNRITQMTLVWLRGLLELAKDSWGHFQAALQAPDAAARLPAVTALKQTLDNLRSKRTLLEEILAGARAEVSEQESRLDGALLDVAATAHASAILDALKARVVAYQRIELAATRVQHQIERWLEDFGAGQHKEGVDYKLLALQARDLAKQTWNFELFAVEESTVVDGKTVTTSYGITVGKSIGALLLYALCYWFFAWLTRRMQRLLVGRFGIDEQSAAVFRRWAMIAVAVVLVILTLNLARIPLTVFAFMGGALAIGIGFGTQTIIKNVISGIIILFERKIRVGDIVAIGGTTGYVTAVDLRASTVRGFDGVEALVPNSTFLENQVVNWTYSNPRIRREIRIGIAYGSPVRKAAEIITGCAAEHGLVLDNPTPEVFLEDFADSAILMALIFWVEMTPTLSGRRVDSDLRFMIDKRLAAEGIQIPFPQRDVHLSVAAAVPVRVMPASDPGA